MIRRIGITLAFPGEGEPVDVTQLYLDGSAHISERLFNEDKRSVQDVFRFSLVYDGPIVDALRSAGGRIGIHVRELDTDSPLFSGVIEPNTSQSSTQVPEPLQLEAVDATWRLDSIIASSFEYPVGIGSAPFKVCDPAEPEHSIFHQVCLLAGYAPLEIAPLLANTDTVLHCAAKAGQQSYREFLDALLFEYGLVLDDDGLGRLGVRKWTRTASGYDETIDAADLSTVEPFHWSRRYIQEDGIIVEWAETQVMLDALLYRDSLPVTTDGVFTGKPIAAGDYYPPDSDIEQTFQEYVDRWLDRPYLERATRLENDDISLVTTDQQQVLFQADDGLLKDFELFESHRARIRFFNSSALTKSIYSFEIRGRALYRSAVRAIRAPLASVNPKTYTSRFIFNATAAAGLANALALDLAYGDFEYSFGLNRYIQPGTIVRLINARNGIDTQAIIQECDWNVGRPVYRYRAVGLAEYAIIPSSSSGRTGAAFWPLIQAIEAQISTDIAAPPSNNVTDVLFASSQNADGTVRIVATWNYLQGTSKGDGVFIYYKQAFSSPPAFDFALDPAEWKAMDASGAYSWQADFPVRTGGIGGAPIHYRFGLVAAAGAKLHTAGAITPLGWEDIVFSGIISASDLNYWDLATGRFRVGTLKKYVDINAQSGEFNIKGLEIELLNSEMKSMQTIYEQLMLKTEVQWRKDGSAIGRIGIDPSNDFVSASNIKWPVDIPIVERTADLPASIQYSALVTVGVFLYGIISDSSSILKYNPQDNTYEQLGYAIVAPKKRAVVVGKTIYVLCTGGGGGIEIIDTVSQASRLVPIGSSRMQNGAFGPVVFEGFIYFQAQGWDGKRYICSFDLGTELYDITEIPQASISGNEVAIVSGKYYVPYGDRILVFDLETKTHTTQSIEGENDLIDSCHLYGGLLYIYRSFSTGSNVLIYDPTDCSYRSVACPNNALARWGVIYGGALYWYTQIANPYVRAILRFDLASETFSSTPVTSIVLGPTCAFGGTVYIAYPGTMFRYQVKVLLNLGAGIVERGSDLASDFGRLEDGFELRPKGYVDNAPSGLNRVLVGDDFISGSRPIFTVTSLILSGTFTMASITDLPIIDKLRHPGVYSIRSSATANSGAVMSENYESIRDTKAFKIVFMLKAALTTRILRFGFQTHLTTIAVPSEGYYLKISNLSAQGIKAAAAAETTVGSARTLTAGVWYTASVSLDDAAGTVSFRIVETDTGVVLLDVSGSLNALSSVAGGAWLGAWNTGAAANLLALIDYVELAYPADAKRGS